MIIDAYLEPSPTFFNGFQIYKTFIVKGMTTTLVTVQPSANVIRDFMNNIMIKANIIVWWGQTFALKVLEHALTNHEFYIKKYTKQQICNYYTIFKTTSKV